jgi:hypothetical protein
MNKKLILSMVILLPVICVLALAYVSQSNPSITPINDTEKLYISNFIVVRFNGTAYFNVTIKNLCSIQITINSFVFTDSNTVERFTVNIIVNPNSNLVYSQTLENDYSNTLSASLIITTTYNTYNLRCEIGESKP